MSLTHTLLLGLLLQCEWHNPSTFLMTVRSYYAHSDALYSPPSTVQVVLSTAHPAKFSEAVSLALKDSTQFDFDRDVMPEEFKGLLQKERRVIDVERPDIQLVKDVVEKHVV